MYIYTYMCTHLFPTTIVSAFGARGTRQRKCTASLNWLFTICRAAEQEMWITLSSSRKVQHRKNMFYQ